MIQKKKISFENLEPGNQILRLLKFIMFPFFTLCPGASELDEPGYGNFLPFDSIASDFLFNSLRVFCMQVFIPSHAANAF